MARALIDSAAGKGGSLPVQRRGTLPALADALVKGMSPLPDSRAPCGLLRPVLSPACPSPRGSEKRYSYVPPALRLDCSYTARLRRGVSVMGQPRKGSGQD